jgi:hypothetical protein
MKMDGKQCRAIIAADRSVMDIAEDMSDMLKDATERPWGWIIHDYSMASLGKIPELADEVGLVLSLGPCPACQGRAKDNGAEWEWGRCNTPSEANARLIVTAVNSYEPMLAALELTKEAVFVLMGPHDFVEINGKEYSGQELFDKIEAAIEAAPRVPAMGGEHE